MGLAILLPIPGRPCGFAAAASISFCCFQCPRATAGCAGSTLMARRRSVLSDSLTFRLGVPQTVFPNLRATAAD